MELFIPGSTLVYFYSDNICCVICVYGVNHMSYNEGVTKVSLKQNPILLIIG